jgi:hypothetical protein
MRIHPNYRNPGFSCVLCPLALVDRDVVEAVVWTVEAVMSLSKNQAEESVEVEKDELHLIQESVLDSGVCPRLLGEVEVDEASCP